MKSLISPVPPKTSSKTSSKIPSKISSQANRKSALPSDGFVPHSHPAKNERKNPIICFSHLRWNFVFQRPQHLFSRFAKVREAFYFEEPIFEKIAQPYLKSDLSCENVTVVTPILPEGLTENEHLAMLRRLVDEMITEFQILKPTLWYYTPMALKFTSHIKGHLTIYDCMDELSLFKGAPPELLGLERKLLQSADLVFTGGHALFEAKVHTHRNIHPVPSSIDFNHFAQARKSPVGAEQVIEKTSEPADQANIPHPRVGFFGVVDERFDIDLIREAATLRPDLQFVIIGPVVKIDAADLPRSSNIHYLGMKNYQELPSYVSGWEAAILPFARNESTRFISPTKTPEYLAAGRPVVSTSIKDVVRPYGELGLVEIADDAENFCHAIDRACAKATRNPEWQNQVDEFLSRNSWDKTFERMLAMENSVEKQKLELDLPLNATLSSQSDGEGLFHRSGWRNLDMTSLRARREQHGQN